MLQHRVVLFAAPLRSAELAGLLFADYMQSSMLQMDLAEVLSDVNGWFSFFRSGFKPSVLLQFYSSLLSERLLFRLLECGVSAVCMYSGSEMCKDAIAFHYVYPMVRDYRYSRFWLTRLLRSVGRFICPSFLRRLGGGGGASSRSRGSGESKRAGTAAATAATAKGKVPAFASGAPRLFENSADRDREANFYRNPPRPLRTDPFEGMPDSCREALRYYLYSYQARPFYTAFVSGFITDVSLFTAEQIMWYSCFYQERNKTTSKWRMWKPFLGRLAGVATESVLVYGVRVGGVLLGQRLVREPTGGSIFWGEHLALLACAPAIHVLSLRVSCAVRDAIERRHPRTVDDEMEDKRVEDEAEEAARAQAAAARAAFAFTAGPSSAGDAAGHAAGGGASGGTSGTSTNYYEVLGVPEVAKGPEIKKAYRAMALRNHPDRVGKDQAAQQQAREQMAVINEAYDTLMDADKRSQYDATRRFADGSDFFKKLESMSTVQLFAVSSAAMVGLSTLAAVSAYGQYVSIFQRVTSLGRAPLYLFE